MKLAPVEIESAVWKKIETEINSQLDLHRQRNDGNLSADETAKIRGTIAAFKIIKSWAKIDACIT